MATKAEDVHESGLFGTQRTDRWWVAPLIISIGFTILIIYSLYAMFAVGPHQVAPEDAVSAGNELLSPLYSPCLVDGCVGPLAGVLPASIAGIPITPALYILWAPLGFRATCYYYRKAYYRSYFADPAACAVEEGRGEEYKGESGFPWILQNIHRYFVPFALLLIVFLSYDAIMSMIFHTGGSTTFGVSIGTLVLTINVVLLAGYTFGCHSLRHLVGGRLDCFTCPSGTRQRKERSSYKGWKLVSWFNQRHMLWAWISFFWVMFSDLYVRLVASGVINDVTLFVL